MALTVAEMIMLRVADMLILTTENNTPKIVPNIFPPGLISPRGSTVKIQQTAVNPKKRDMGRGMKVR